MRDDVPVAILPLLGQLTKVALMPCFHLSYDRIEDIIADSQQLELELARHGLTHNVLAICEQDYFHQPGENNHAVVFIFDPYGKETIFKLLRPPKAPVSTAWKNLRYLDLARTCSIRFYSLLPMGPRYEFLHRLNEDRAEDIVKREMEVLKGTVQAASGWLIHTKNIANFPSSMSYLQVPSYFAYESTAEASKRCFFLQHKIGRAGQNLQKFYDMNSAQIKEDMELHRVKMQQQKVAKQFGHLSRKLNAIKKNEKAAKLRNNRKQEKAQKILRAQLEAELSSVASELQDQGETQIQTSTQRYDPFIPQHPHKYLTFPGQEMQLLFNQSQQIEFQPSRQVSEHDQVNMRNQAFSFPKTVQQAGYEEIFRLLYADTQKEMKNDTLFAIKADIPYVESGPNEITEVLSSESGSEFEE